MDKKLGFKDFLSVDYAPGEPDQVKYNAKKRKVEAKAGYCSDKCCGSDVKAEDCPCPADCPHCDCNKNVEEALSLQQRMKRSRTMKKYASRMKIGRQKAARRMADPKRLKRRAQKQARNMLAKKLAKADYSSLSFSRKQEIEKRLQKMKPRLDRMAKKLLPKMRKLEQERKRGGARPKLDKAIAKND